MTKEILERLTEIEKHLAVYNQQLEYHIKRTDLLEAKVNHVDKHVTMVNGVIKFLLGIGALAGFIKLFL